MKIFTREKTRKKRNILWVIRGKRLYFDEILFAGHLLIRQHSNSRARVEFREWLFPFLYACLTTVPHVNQERLWETKIRGILLVSKESSGTVALRSPDQTERRKKMIPQDPVMLLSFINLKLRDYYPSLQECCDSLSIDPRKLTQKLLTIGYQYDETRNQFV